MEGSVAPAPRPHRQAVGVDEVGAATFEQRGAGVARSRRSSTSGRRGASRARRSSRTSRASPDEWGERARLVRVNVDEEPGVSSRYGVLSLPDRDPLRRRGAEGDRLRRAAASALRARVQLRTCDDHRDAAGPTCSRARRSRTRASSPRASRRSSRSPTTSIRASPPSLVATGVTALFRHQAETWEAARRGENVVVTTGTASGKSLAFNLPVLDAIARDPKTRALYLYPTKALAQDQARSLAELRLKGLRPAIYDGDTPSERRWQIRKWSNVVLTNPDMLHVGVLPHHDRWGDVLANLRYVVVDEAHVYRGVFGSHVANVLRRLRRLARIYDAEPQFLLASATIANAGRARARADRRARDRRRHGHLGARRARGRDLEPAAARRRARAAREPTRRRGATSLPAHVARAADDLLREEPQGGRADPPLRRRARRHRDGSSARARTEPATRPSSGARSSGASSRASSSA